MRSRRTRTLAIRPMGQQSSEINVTPLVDVVLVLLIIFMVVTPLLEKDIGVKVPATEQVQSASQVPQSQLVVQLAASGDLRINDRPVDEASYVARLRDILAERFDKTVFVVPEDGANYGRVVRVLDGAKQAGAAVLGVATEVTPQ
ncbi:MAG: biopolymer transporter ExbD [Deltaproteobacteria bacterium]|nr:biopolymer transporter ExbD [Deltaproteobacteria bacterium]